MRRLTIPPIGLAAFTTPQLTIPSTRLPSTLITEFNLPLAPGYLNSTVGPSSGFFNSGAGGNSGFANNGVGLSGWYSSNGPGLLAGSGFQN